MVAGIYKLEIEQGETFTRLLTYEDSEEALINLTGYTARMQIRKTADSTDYLLSLTTENSGIALGGIAGTITITITAAQSANLPIGTARYDLELISGSGVVVKLLKGDVTVNREITR